MTTNDYIISHRNDDVRQLALQTAPEGVDLRSALVQISGWQKATHKLPSWATTDGIIFPEHISMEQCSSEPTAEYKLGIARRLCSGGGRMIDLTAGFGVDATIISRHFKHLTAVERNPQLCQILRNNLPLMGISQNEVVCTDCTEYIDTLTDVCTPFQLLFIDPARRDAGGRKTVLISDCTPDVGTLLPRLLRMAEVVMIKLSPMLDTTSVEHDLHGLTELHIVSVGGECKEVIAIAKQTDDVNDAEVSIHAVNLSPSVGAREPHTPFIFRRSEESAAAVRYLALTTSDSTPAYLYEPNASILKSGAYRTVADRYRLLKASANSHLYFSDSLAEDFPGRRFRIINAVQPNKAGIKALASLTRANITTRNYPISACDLRRKLRLADGGDTYIFATTLADNQHILFVTEKV